MTGREREIFAGTFALALAACGGNSSFSAGKPTASVATAQVSTLAGSGASDRADDQGAVASFNHPVGVAVDASGNVYVADTGHNLIRKIDARDK